ncbi:hypothetical protein Acr_11g0010780 [Actinidia rufa]|uniref:Uncharacterized protein n=1 Tax=Actinidia rufa TaxID=165716 RepID=A0A7J0FDJ5_9ERIC|nr:hypothetical protein Acr_11g0010780 [Actinidia rufa]
MENCEFDRVRDRLTAFIADSIAVFKCCCLTDVDLEAGRVEISLKVVHKSTVFMAKVDLFGIWYLLGGGLNSELALQCSNTAGNASGCTRVRVKARVLEEFKDLILKAAMLALAANGQILLIASKSSAYA